MKKKRKKHTTWALETYASREPHRRRPPAASVAAPRGVGNGRFGGGYTSLVFLITVSKNEKKMKKKNTTWALETYASREPHRRRPPAASVAAPAAPRGVGGGYMSRGGGEGHRLGRTRLVFLITVSKNEKKMKKKHYLGSRDIRVSRAPSSSTPSCLCCCTCCTWRGWWWPVWWWLHESLWW